MLTMRQSRIWLYVFVGLCLAISRIIYCLRQSSIIFSSSTGLLRSPASMNLQETLEICTQWMATGPSTSKWDKFIDGSWKNIVCTKPAVKPEGVCEGQHRQHPLIAILAGISTRGVDWITPTDLAPFRHLLPSTVKTTGCGFRYEVILGYDIGDAFYDSTPGQEVLTRWFQMHVQHPLLRSNIDINLVLVKVNNTLKKPGPAFNEIARVAYKRGAEFFFRVNDDSEFLQPWAYKFVRALLGMGYPYGVVGPYSEQNNIRILNHDFTHRVHMEIFDGNYYPPQLSDYWMDDWISMVYGDGRTRQARFIEIYHHIFTQNRRYDVDMDNASLLQGLVEDGKSKISNWMLSHGLERDIVREYNSSRFDGYPFEDIR